jgi:hypothetical protein
MEAVEAAAQLHELLPFVPIGCKSPQKRGPYSMLIHTWSFARFTGSCGARTRGASSVARRDMGPSAPAGKHQL